MSIVASRTVPECIGEDRCIVPMFPDVKERSFRGGCGVSGE